MKEFFFFTCTPVMEFRKFGIELLLKWILNIFTLPASSYSYFINYIHAQSLQMGNVFLSICVLSILLLLMMSSRNVTRIFTSLFFWHLRIFYLIPHWLTCVFNNFFLNKHSFIFSFPSIALVYFNCLFSPFIPCCIDIKFHFMFFFTTWNILLLLCCLAEYTQLQCCFLNLPTLLQTSCLEEVQNFHLTS